MNNNKFFNVEREEWEFDAHSKHIPRPKAQLKEFVNQRVTWFANCPDGDDGYLGGPELFPEETEICECGVSLSRKNRILRVDTQLMPILRAYKMYALYRPPSSIPKVYFKFVFMYNYALLFVLKEC